VVLAASAAPLQRACGGCFLLLLLPLLHWLGLSHS
jgi:hypothetical protein